MLPEVRNSSEVYGQTNMGVKVAYVFLLQVSRVTNKRHFTAIYVHAQAKQKNTYWYRLLYVASHR